MAYNLSASPSASLSQETHLFCNSLSPPDLLHLRTHRNLTFPLNKLLPFRFSSRVSLQEQSTTTTDSDTVKPKPPSKSSVWVNPNSSRAPKLRQTSYDSRYNALLKLAENLDSCRPVQEDITSLLDILADKYGKVIQQDAVTVLNNMSNADTALLVLDYFLQRLTSAKDKEKEVIMYNVTLKVLRKSNDIDGAEKLFGVMIERGVKPDNVTFSTIISCARQCKLPEKAIEWFEKMGSLGCEPDPVNFAGMIDSYGKMGRMDVALKLYDKARSEKWRLVAGTFATLIKIYGVSKNFDGCLNVYEEMKALGVKPNVAVYNTLLDAMGRAMRPWQVKTIYKEMLDSGVEPTLSTYSCLIRAYGKAKYGEDSLAVYREMKEKGVELTVVLYNILLSTCADAGFTEEAKEILKDMKSSGNCKPDSFTFSALITIYSCSGNVEEAEATVSEMLEAGIEPTLFISTSLIQCYGKAGRIDDVVRTFDRLVELGIDLDERFCCCLLNVISDAPVDELGRLINCVEKANPKLGYVVKLIVEGEIEGETFTKEARELFDSISADIRKAYCNCLIDQCINLNKLERACELLDLGFSLGMYSDIMSRTPTQWSLHLKGLSLGAALTALHVWINDLTKALENGEELPSLLGINTGHGKHKFSEKGIAGVFESHLKELNAPFHDAPDQVGWFLTTKVAAMSWLESRRSNEVVAA